MALLTFEVPYDPSKIFENPLVELTQSAIGTYQSCEQKFVLRYLMQLASRSVAIPLTVGTAVHKGLEIILSPANTMIAPDILLKMALHEVDIIFEAVLEKDAALLGNAAEKLNHGRAQAHACVMAWHFHYFTAVGKEFTVLSTEEVFRATPGATVNSPLLDRMAGKLDGHILDSMNEHALMETKTKASLTSFDWINGLALDRQLMWYLYKAGDVWGFPIEKVYYNVIGKPAHRAAVGWEALKMRMVEAMYGDPAKYLTMPIILVDQDDLQRQCTNWKRVIERMDNISAETVTMNTSACTEWGGCAYKALCQRRADVADPAAILDMPESDLYCFRAPHEELEEE